MTFRIDYASLNVLVRLLLACHGRASMLLLVSRDPQVRDVQRFDFSSIVP